MKNVTMSLSGNTLTITLDITKDFGLSASGKSMTVASTSGNITVPGTDLKLGLNAYRSAK
jgi:hypothetical protein